MRDPHKYTWADPYRDEARWDPGTCLVVAVIGCAMFWIAVVVAIRWLRS